MRTPLPFPPMLPAVLALVCLAGCQPANSQRPVPSVPQIGADLKCTHGDHGFEDSQLGWGFCYPSNWRYRERAQSSESPTGLDLTFDITYVPATPQPCPSVRPAGSSPCPGDFAYMILSTYDRGPAPDLGAWLAQNMKTASTLSPISWGNSQEAGRLRDGRRLALTPKWVVVMDLHSGLLDLEGEMSARLDTWRFSS